MSNAGVLAATLAFAVASCATEEGYQNVVRSFVGSSEAALLAQWGPPDRVYSSDGDTKYLTYDKSWSGSTPGVPLTYQTSCSFGICTTIPIGGSPGHSYTDTCKTSFKVVHGLIASWQFEGNACRA